jgi:translocator assembly and maintenance protein 41
MAAVRGGSRGLQEILKLVPKVSFAAAYGSAVIKQDGYAGSGMVDYIFAVDRPDQWHAENIRMNGFRHYSPLGALGGTGVAMIQKLGAGVYFNVPRLDHGEAKYAVIQTDALCKELRDWNNLYLSGRLQKPVATLVPNADVDQAQAENLRAALHSALVFLPERFSDTQLYTAISSLSYMGDPRMTAGGEHPDKPQMIAQGQEQAFAALYSDALKSAEGAGLCAATSGGGDKVMVIEQDMSPAARARVYSTLPESVIQLTANKLRGGGGVGGVVSKGDARDFVAEAIERDPSQARPMLAHSISAIVRPAAKVQMVKGLFSFGAATAAKYVAHKIKRTFDKR